MSNSWEREVPVRGLLLDASFTTDGSWICFCSSHMKIGYWNIYEANSEGRRMRGTFAIEPNSKLSRELDFRSELLLPFNHSPQFIVQGNGALVFCSTNRYDDSIIRMQSAQSSDRVRFGAVLDTENAVVLMRQSLLGRAQVEIVPFTNGKVARAVSCGKLKIRFDPLTCGAAIRREGDNVYILVSHPDGSLEMQLLDLGPGKSGFEAPPGSSTGEERSTSGMDDIPSFDAGGSPLAALETSHDPSPFLRPLPSPVAAEPVSPQSLNMDLIASSGPELITDPTPSTISLDTEDSTQNSEPHLAAEGRQNHGSTGTKINVVLGKPASLQNNPRGRDTIPHDHTIGTDFMRKSPSGDSSRSRSPRNRFLNSDSSNPMSVSTTGEKSIDLENRQLAKAKQLLTDVGLAHLATSSTRSHEQLHEGKSVSHTLGGGLEETDYGKLGHENWTFENIRNDKGDDYSLEPGPNPKDDAVILEIDASEVSKAGPLDHPAEDLTLA